MTDQKAEELTKAGVADYFSRAKTKNELVKGTQDDVWLFNHITGEMGKTLLWLLLSDDGIYNLFMNPNSYAPTDPARNFSIEARESALVPRLFKKVDRNGILKLICCNVLLKELRPPKFN